MRAHTKKPTVTASSRRSTRAASSAPWVRFFLADDVRIESNGKLIAIGLYADSVVVVPLPSDAPDPSAQEPIGLAQLAFVITVGGGEGTFDTEIQVGDKAESALSRSITLVPGKSNNVIVKSQPMLINSFGVKPVFVRLGGVEHYFEFEVRRQGMSAEVGSLIQPEQSLDKPVRMRAKAKHSTKK